MAVQRVERRGAGPQHDAAVRRAAAGDPRLEGYDSRHAAPVLATARAAGLAVVSAASWRRFMPLLASGALRPAHDEVEAGTTGTRWGRSTSARAARLLGAASCSGNFMSGLNVRPSSRLRAGCTGALPVRGRAGKSSPPSRSPRCPPASRVSAALPRTSMRSPWGRFIDAAAQAPGRSGAGRSSASPPLNWMYWPRPRARHCGARNSCGRRRQTHRWARRAGECALARRVISPQAARNWKGQLAGNT